MNEQKEELLNRSESKGESAVTALRVDVAALNASLHNINTVSDSFDKLKTSVLFADVKL